MNTHHPNSMPPAVRAPHADPFGQFRGAPLGRRRRAKYSAVLFGLFLLFAAIPFMLDANLPDRAGGAEDADEAMAMNLSTTYAEWKLRFGALDDQCQVDRGVAGTMTVNYDCGQWKAQIMGMAEVKSDNDAIATALSRSVRVINASDTGDMGAHKITDEALKINPEVLQRSGAKDVWMSDPYSSEQTAGDGVGGHDASELSHYTVGFYKPSAKDDSQGLLVTVQVSGEQLDEAHARVEKLVETARIAPGSEADTAGGSDV